MVGTVGQAPVYSIEGPMPEGDAWVLDDKRVRRLQPSERSRALGLGWDVSQVTQIGARLLRTTGVHLWAAVAEGLLPQDDCTSVSRSGAETQGAQPAVIPVFRSEPVEWQWSVPDLRPKGGRSEGAGSSLEQLH